MSEQAERLLALMAASTIQLIMAKVARIWPYQASNCSTCHFSSGSYVIW